MHDQLDGVPTQSSHIAPTPKCIRCSVWNFCPQVWLSKQQPCSGLITVLQYVRGSRALNWVWVSYYHCNLLSVRPNMPEAMDCVILSLEIVESMKISCLNSDACQPGRAAGGTSWTPALQSTLSIPSQMWPGPPSVAPFLEQNAISTKITGWFRVVRWERRRTD